MVTEICSFKDNFMGGGEGIYLVSKTDEIIFILIELSKTFPTLYVVGKYLYYSIVYCYLTISSYV